MKPLPAQRAIGDPDEQTPIRQPLTVLHSSPAAFSTSNRRAPSCSIQRIYPLLLFTSTAIAALFCVMYVTKPVIVQEISSSRTSDPKPSTAPPPTTATTASEPGLMPGKDRLPGEGNPGSASSGTAPPVHAATASLPAFEETNLRIQHILTAEAPGGHLDRIDLDVPVIYQSRNLRWTTAEIAEARKLLGQLMDYQEKSRSLRAGGIELLESWNHLINKSIPSTDLRADSPSLPTNQSDAGTEPKAAALITNESIQIKPAGQ
jgi:hypothetical protein